MPQRAAHCRDLWSRGSGRVPHNLGHLDKRYTRETAISPNCLVCGSHTLNNTLVAQINHLAIFQVNVKHQLIWWSDSQQLTGGLNLTVLERGANEIVAEATSVGRSSLTSEWRSHLQPVLGTLQDPKHQPASIRGQGSGNSRDPRKRVF